MMERLELGEGSSYRAIEAAIHLNRYLLARPYCTGKRVLDVACGEGYGSYLMAERWGASSVVGLDVSAEAIESAREMFDSPRIRFQQHDAQRLSDQFEPGSFDLVVSFETIEHVEYPAALLRGIKHVLSPEGVVVISCPNDWWYFPRENEGNPHHVRKFTLQEFRSMAEDVLGPASRFMLGTAAMGFTNVDAGDELIGEKPRTWAAIVQARDQLDALLTSADPRIGDTDCSYFVGLWGAPAERSRPSAVLYPCTMDAGPLGMEREAIERMHAIIGERAKLAKRVEELRQATARHQERERHAELRARALAAETAFVSERMGHLQWEMRNATGAIADLESLTAESRQTIADQAKLVDERDTYIKALEARLNDAHEQIRALHEQLRVLREERRQSFVQRALRRWRKPQPGSGIF